jgi:acetyl esterase
MALDPGAAALLQQMAQTGAPPIHQLPVPEARRMMQMMVAAAPRPQVGRVEDRAIPGPAGEIPVRIYWPRSGQRVGLVVY